MIVFAMVGCLASAGVIYSLLNREAGLALDPTEKHVDGFAVYLLVVLVAATLYFFVRSLLG